jgi:hypothetical protein
VAAEQEEGGIHLLRIGLALRLLSFSAVVSAFALLFVDFLLSYGQGFQITMTTDTAGEFWPEIGVFVMAIPGIVLLGRDLWGRL